MTRILYNTDEGCFLLGSMLATLSVFLCPYSKNSLGFSLKELKLYTELTTGDIYLSSTEEYCFVLRRQSILCSIEKICRLSDTEGGLTEEIDIYRHFERSIGKQSSNKIVKYLAVEPSGVSENVNLCSPD